MSWSCLAGKLTITSYRSSVSEGGANFSGTAVGGATVTRETVNQLVQEYGQQLFGNEKFLV